MQKVTKVLPRQPAPAVRPYIYNVPPPQPAPIIRVGYLFKGPTLVFSVPRWILRRLRYFRFRVLE